MVVTLVSDGGILFKGRRTFRLIEKIAYVTFFSRSFDHSSHEDKISSRNVIVFSTSKTSYKNDVSSFLAPHKTITGHTLTPENKTNARGKENDYY